MPSRILVVGAGFAGSVIAERLASAGHQVRLIDRRSHIAGNAYDELDEHGVLVHRYGPHIFHTSSEEVYAYLSRFTSWRSYEHRVLASTDVGLVPMPVNLDTLGMIFGQSFDETSAEAHLNQVTEHFDRITNSEELVLSRVGRTVYEKVFLNYTLKQWGLHPSELDATVAGRLPIRLNHDDRYFTDTYQVMPSSGYTAMFKSMIDHPNIDVQLSTDFDHSMMDDYDHTVFTGPIDAFFNRKYGPLPYRSLDFEFEHVEAVEFAQQTGTVNFPNDFQYTRSTEFKHLTGQDVSGTTLCREYPTSDGDPYYPVPSQTSRSLYQRYQAEAEGICDRVTFAGRLGTYKYYNMDQVVAQAMALSDQVLQKIR